MTQLQHHLDATPEEVENLVAHLGNRFSLSLHRDHSNELKGIHLHADPKGHRWSKPHGVSGKCSLTFTFDQVGDPGLRFGLTETTHVINTLAERPHVYLQLPANREELIYRELGKRERNRLAAEAKAQGLGAQGQETAIVGAQPDKQPITYSRAVDPGRFRGGAQQPSLPLQPAPKPSLAACDAMETDGTPRSFEELEAEAQVCIKRLNAIRGMHPGISFFKHNETGKLGIIV